MRIMVVDSSVFNKLYLDEVDRDKAGQLFADTVAGSIGLIAPDLLYLEVVNTAQRVRVPIDQVIGLLDDTRYLMTIRAVTDLERNKALEIITHGHPSSGYPSIYDALFHAMAICNNATLVTADRRHYQKTQQLGHITLLHDYELHRFSDSC